MNTNKLLDQCLLILREIKDDRKSLEILLEFMQQEFCKEELEQTETIDYMAQVPEKYRECIKSIAENMESGCISFVNPETLKVAGMPKELEYRDFEFDNFDIEECFRIEPLHSSLGFQIMSSFVDRLPQCKDKQRLSDAIDGHKPFANFNRLIHQSEYREDWFAHRARFCKKYVIENHLDEVIRNIENM
jgi:hypothetical protein